MITDTTSFRHGWRGRLVSEKAVFASIVQASVMGATGMTPEEALEAFNKDVRARLDERGWTQAALASKSGVGKSTLSYLLKGKRKLKIRTAEKLASSLGYKKDRFNKYIVYESSVRGTKKSKLNENKITKLARGEFGLTADGILIFRDDEDPLKVAKMRSRLNEQFSTADTKSGGSQSDPAP